MRTKLFFLFLFVATVFLSIGFPKVALADSFSLSGSVKDSSGNAIPNATISVNDVNLDSTTTDSSGNYSFSAISGGSYDVQVTPSSGSNFSSATALNQNISSSSVINFILVPAGTVKISGTLYDSLGNPLVGQFMSLQLTNGSQVTSSTTDTSGNYSFQTSSGTYHISILSNNTDGNIPTQYSLTLSDKSYTQSIIQNFTFPAKKVSLHIQDGSGNAVGNVSVSTGTNQVAESNLSLGGGVTVSGTNGYTSNALRSDSSGNATMWLFPGNNAYTIIATPPGGLGLSHTTFSNNHITGDTTLNLTLQNSITISGVLLDPLSNPLAGQSMTLNLSDGSQIGSTTTDASGHYSFQTSQGTYHIVVVSNDAANNIPQRYSLSFPNTSYTQSTTQNITMPAKQVNIHIQDGAGTSIGNVILKNGDNQISENNLPVGGGVTVSGSDGYTDNSLRTDSSGNATMWLFPGTNSYPIIAIPPGGQGLSQTTFSNNIIAANTNLTFTMQRAITLTGTVYDSLNNPLAGQFLSLQLSNGSQVASATTDTSGNYSFQTSSGTYHLVVLSNNTGGNIPTQYSLTLPDTLYSQSTTQNVTMPAKKISVHVQDGIGIPVNNVILSTGSNQIAENNLSIGGSTTANGTNGYTNNSLRTDSSGNATMWLFPGTNTYTVIATPPGGSIYSQFTLNNLSVTSDQTELISLQYSHATPVTTATLSPAQNSDGTYPNPVSVTLSATAASGYTVARTYYTVDGGTQQTYASAFSVSGNGSHTVHYWSDDNSGVTEAQNTKTFTIAATYSLSGTVYVDTNQNGFQDTGEAGYSGATVSLNGGQTATTDSNSNYSFTNLQADTYTETLTLPNGYSATTTNPATVALSTDTTENFGIAQSNSLVLAINAGGDTQGNFVADTDSTGGTTYSSSNAVDITDVANPAPEAVYKTVRYGNFSYAIPNLTANGTYTVRLHFNELYWGTSLAGGNGGEGSRVFNVSVNGTQALSNYDIFQHAGGANKAIVEQLPATADNNGTITLQFSTVTDNAMVNGIEIYSGTLPSPTPTATPTPVTSLAIDSGGATVSNFLADTDFSGGQPYTSTASVDTSGVTNPAPEAVYQSVRYGNMTYTIPHLVPSTSYTVRLHFNELYWGTALTGNTGGEGSRVFNVSINANQVLTNFDIYQQAGGANKAIVKDFTANSDANGKITIVFTTVADNAMVNGIELFQ